MAFVNKEKQKFYEKEFNKLERNQTYEVYSYWGNNPNLHTEWAYLDQYGDWGGVPENHHIVGIKDILDRWEEKVRQTEQER